MEKYLSRNLDSFINSGCLDVLELIIVNDGSKDNTLEIANDYKSKYTETVIVIDKPNGHYGSCVNAALQVATGKYFRIVDADDWVDSNTLRSLMSTLETVETDVVYTQFSNNYEDKGCTELVPYPKYVKWGEAAYLNDIIFETEYLHMHCLTYKTEFLLRIGYRQTEGICYTDTEYVYKPLICAVDIYCIKDSLYQYYIGRNDQSTAPKVLAKNYSHFEKVLKSVVNHKPSEKLNNKAQNIKQEYACILLSYMIPIAISGRLTVLQTTELRDIIKDLQLENLDLSKVWNTSYYGIRMNYLWYRN